MTGRFDDSQDFGALVEIARREPLFLRHLGHMRQRFDVGRLGFALGAGVSEQAGVPMWGELIKRLHCHYGTGGPPDCYKDGNHPATLTVQFIFNRFRTARLAEVKFDSNPSIIPIAIQNEWYRHIHEAIYRDVPDPATIMAKHPYLQELAYLVFMSPFCLTLNFDDILDRLAEKIVVEGSSREKPNVIWRPPAIDRSNSCVTYHVNGYLPRSAGARRSEAVILTEDSFASMQLSANPHETEYVMSRVVSNTLLVIGASFDDPSLRSLFYAAARRNPSSFHYSLQHDEDVSSENVDSPERFDRRTLNREMYNIVTYFVTKAEIQSVVRTLRLPQEDFVQLTRRIEADVGHRGSVSHFYVVGSVSSGKSSLIERLRSFRTFEEWPEAPLELMFRDPKSLTPEEKAEVDAWVLKQLARKNDLMQSSQYGIFIMDRAPLDMFAFSQDPEENIKKAKELLVLVGAGGLKSGGIILLTASSEVLLERQIRRGRGPEWLKDAAYKAEGLARQDDKIKAIYKVDDALDTSRLSIDEVARQAAVRILFDSYVTVSLEDRRAAIEAGENVGA